MCMMVVVVHHSPGIVIVEAEGFELFSIKVVDVGLVKRTSKRGTCGINYFVIDVNHFGNGYVTVRGIDCSDDSPVVKPCILVDNALGADFQPCLLNY